MRYTLLHIITLFLLLSCSGKTEQEERYAEIVSQWQGREIKLPAVMTDFLTGDTINLDDADFTILTYVDSTGSVSYTHLKISLLLLFITLLAGGVARADDASRTILDRAAAAFNGSKSIKATFSTDIDGSTTTGTITIQGDKFHISSKEYSTWYDGKTQWSYSSASNEVNITEPTPEELTEINQMCIRDRL